MPLEIRELVIKATVGEAVADEQNASNNRDASDAKEAEAFS